MALPITYDSARKLISVDSEVSYPELQDEVTQLNKLAKDLISIQGEIPESAEPSNKITPLLKNLITSGIDALRKKQFKDAIQKLTVAIEMQQKRANWESFGVQLTELNGILQARCDAYIMNKQFIEAYNDADILLSTQVNTPDNFLRKAIASLNLGRLEDAKVNLERGLCFHENDKRLIDHLNVVNRAIDLENGDA
ncbi:hypothetical protein WICMUC_003965 [Wickerhamomyces mucosus]|uniref:Translocation protein SEC72 n=1 Tax=Wickerhamomyces mucosus TaxID=1378264 RepID=A0A9P8PJK9_9ASCO|nr:hypothetical protein WICMUC_003965 [Wickerhamomyces mucosus]